MNKLAIEIESILFTANKPVKLKQLTEALDATEEQVTTAVTELIEARKESGVLVLQKDDQIQMATNPVTSPVVKQFLEAELRSRLTDATLETLAIIAYKQPISKAAIEAIRGVNCQYALRHLMMRGLIERVGSDDDKRMILYRTTLEFMKHMGLKDMKELPDFAELTEKIKVPNDMIPEGQAAPEGPAEADNVAATDVDPVVPSATPKE